jgi:hypothetical protein
LEGVTSVEHEAGTDVFVVQHRRPLSDAAHAVNRVVIARWARRGLEQLRASLTRSGTKSAVAIRHDLCRGRGVMSIDIQTLIIAVLAGYILGMWTALRLEHRSR